MIVRYARLCERFESLQNDPSLTVGKEYLVFVIAFSSHRCETVFSIQADSDGTPILRNAKDFDIVDPRLPDGWGCYVFTAEHLAIYPADLAGGLWDRYHDGDEEAERIFEAVKQKLIAFHAKSPE